MPPLLLERHGLREVIFRQSRCRQGGMRSAHRQRQRAVHNVVTLVTRQPCLPKKNIWITRGYEKND